MQEKHLEQFERVKRWMLRIKDITSGREHDRESSYYEDDIYAFFQNCFHLKDWLMNSDALLPGINVDDFINQHEEMKICRDLCNISKHLKITRPSIDDNIKIGSEQIKLSLGGENPKIAVTYKIEACGKNYFAFDLATKCVNLWQEFLDKNEKAHTIPEFPTKKLYVSSEIGLRMRSAPEIKDSNIIITLEFGKEVSVIQEQDKWFKVKVDDKEGWVSCYYLTENLPIKQSADLPKKESVNDMSPVFKIGVQNLANDFNTVKLRKIINDEFGGGANGYDLQCTEYAQYKIKQLGFTIIWPSERPRHGGRWATIFENSGKYKVSSQPKAGSAMSFTSGLQNSNIGHVAFVEEIYNDESIKISEANWPPPGKYNERILAKSLWQDKYKGRFIDFS